MAKTKEIKVIQSNWGYGWEDESIYERDEYNNVRHDYQEYCLAYKNNGGRVRVITRRVPTNA